MSAGSPAVTLELILTLGRARDGVQWERPTMENRTVSLATLAILIALLGRQAPPPSPPPLIPAPRVDTPPPRSAEPVKRAKPAARAEKVPPEAAVALGLLHQFFGVHFHGSPAPPSYEVGVIIATLPDPTDTHSDWAYDTDLEAIRRGYETAGFVVDRFWIPDPADSVPEKTSGKVARREREPGVLLFRHRDRAAHRLQFLLTVPEAPTGGIYKDAFRVALTVRRAILTHHDLPLRPVDRRVVRVIGPTFSGSALSLRLILQGVLERRDTADIVSGTATNLDNQATLESDRPWIRFRAAINPDTSLQTALEALVIQRLGLRRTQVAVVRESSTQYGGALLSDTTPTGFLSITFPMSISSLRTAYSQVPRTEQKPSGPGITPAPPKLGLDLIDPARPKEDLPNRSRLTPPTVDLLFDEVAAVLRRDGIRLVGLMATDVRDKLFLAAELRRRVRDLQFFTFESNVLYLRSDWRSSLSGMLVLSTYPLTLGGVLPDRSSAADRSRLAFANDGAQGSYNATLLQLGMRGSLLDYAPPLLDSASGAPTTPTTDRPRVRRPPIWISVVGSEVFLPLAVMVDTSAIVQAYVAADSLPASSTAGPEAGLSSTDPSLEPRFLQLLVAVLSTIAFVWLAGRSLKGDFGAYKQVRRRFLVPTDKALPELREEVRDRSLLVHERLYSALRLLAIGGIWLVTAGMLVWGYIDRHPGLGWLSRVVGCAAEVVIGLAMLSATLLLIGLLPAGIAYGRKLNWLAFSPRVEDSGVLWSFELVGRLGVVVFGLTYYCLSVKFSQEPQAFPFRQLFYLRASNLESLVTPILPLVASGAAFTAWCSWHLTRINLLRHDTAYGAASSRELPLLGAADTARLDLERRLQRAATYARTSWNSLFLVFPHLAALAVLLLVGLASAWLWPEFGRTLEAINYTLEGRSLSTFDWLLRLSILASFTTTLWAVVRLLTVWGWLKNCLDELTVLPLLDGFKRLPAGVRRLARLSLPGRNVVTSVAGTSIRQWQQLKDLYATKEAEILKEAGNPPGLKQRLDDVMSGSEVFPRDPDTKRPPAALAEKIRGLQSVLAQLWSLEALTPAGAAAGTNTLTLFRQKAEEYLDTQVVGFAEWVVAHLRVLALFLLLSLILTTVMLYTYPFQPQGLVRILFTIVLLFSVGSVVYVSIQMNRHELLSMLAGTDAGTVTWDKRLVSNLLTFGAVPLLTLLGSAVPSLREVLSSWFEPLLRIIQQ